MILLNGAANSGTSFVLKDVNMSWCLSGDRLERGASLEKQKAAAVGNEQSFLIMLSNTYKLCPCFELLT